MFVFLHYKMSEQENQRKTYFIVNQDDDIYTVDRETGKSSAHNPTSKDSEDKTSWENNEQPNGRWTFRWPEEFLNSTNRKWIEVHHVYIAWKEVGAPAATRVQMTNDSILHSDLVKRDAYLDHTVIVCNETRTKYKKYEYCSPDKTFSVWFSSFANPKFKFDYDNTKFIIEMMLIY